MKEYLKKIDINFLQNVIFAGLIFTLPNNLFKVFFEDTSYIKGLRIDYLIPKLHLSDLIIFLLLISFILIKENRYYLKLLFIRNYKKIWFFILFTLVILQLNTNHPFVGLMFIIRISELSIIGILLKKNKSIIKSETFLITVKLTIVFQSLLSWYQYLKQESFLGYYFFGETNLNSYAGIAKSNFLGIEKILPYGTTAHPNVLGGILAIFSLVLLKTSLKKNKYLQLNIFIYLLGLFTVFLTQSISAIMCLLIGSIIILNKRKIKISVKKYLAIFLTTNIIAISLFALMPSTNTSISRRAYLNSAAINMIINKPFIGVGLQNFTSEVENYTNEQEVVRFVQPVHNFLLLIISQAGLMGIILISTLLIPIIRENKKINHPEFLLAIIPIMVLDHYLFTIQSGILLLFFCIIMIQSYSK